MTQRNLKCFIACASILLLFVFASTTARAIQLVSEEEAARPDDPNAGERGSPTAGPEIEVVSPKLTGLVNSPFRFRIVFTAHGGASINRDSISISYRKVPASDITQRVETFIRSNEIDVEGAELPAGTHPFRIDVKDSRGRWAQPLFFKINVAKPMVR
jgi:hypothetical protein